MHPHPLIFLTVMTNQRPPSMEVSPVPPNVIHDRLRQGGVVRRGGPGCSLGRSPLIPFDQCVEASISAPDAHHLFFPKRLGSPGLPALGVATQRRDDFISLHCPMGQAGHWCTAWAGAAATKRWCGGEGSCLEKSRHGPGSWETRGGGGGSVVASMSMWIQTLAPSPVPGFNGTLLGSV